MGERKAAVSLRWLFLLGVVSACSEQVSSVTTVSSLVPESPTSPHSSSDATNDGAVDAAAGHHSAGPTALPDGASSTNGGNTESAPTDEPWATADAGELEPVDTTPTNVPAEAGAATPVVDGHLPELSPKEDANPCGIPVDNGPPLCDPVANCGCDAEQTCAFTPDRVRLFTCVPPGDTVNGARCSNDDACRRGSVCANGLCAATCRFDSDCGEDKCAAVPSNDGFIENLRVCVATCNPLDPHACGAGATCANVPGTATFTCGLQVSSGEANDPCTTSSECAPGLGCALDGVCRAWCPLSTDATDAGDAGSAAASIASDAPTTGNLCPEYSECLPFDTSGGLGLCGAPCPVPDVADSECSIIPTTCGCSDGNTCQVDVTGKTQCVAPGDHTAMEWCSKNADCAAGLSCVGALCRPICDTELLPCADGSGCVRASSAPNSPSMCLGHCDPVRPDLDDDEFTPCGVGAYCAPGSNDATSSQSYCARQSDTPSKEGAACTTDFECKNGFGCDADSHTCQPWCREPEDCAAGKTCDLGVSPPRSAGEADPVGLCR